MFSAYEMTPDKVYQPATENDYNVEDLSSNDETDNEDNPRKKIPKWAEYDNLRRDVQRLFKAVSKDAINSYFGILRPPRLGELFGGFGKKYDSGINETTSWDSPIANPRSAPLLSTTNLKHKK